MNRKVIHVYAGFITQIAEVLQEALPDVKIINVPLTAPYSPYGHRPTPDEELQCLQGAEIIVGEEPLFTPVLDKIPTLKWVQGIWAGVSLITKVYKNKSPPSYPVTRVVGANRSRQMAEFVVGRIIEDQRMWFYTYEFQKQPSPDYVKLKNTTRYYKTMWSLTVGILGVGVIGKEIAKVLKMLGCHIIGLCRKAPEGEGKSEHIDEYRVTSDLTQFLGECDYLVNVLPSTSETKNLLGGNVLRDAKKKPALINIGRGDIISTSDIIDALDKEWISMAYLDVFETEPVPSDSPLWAHPKVIMSPHAAAVGDITDTVADIVENYNRFTSGQPLKYRVDFSSGY